MPLIINSPATANRPNLYFLAQSPPASVVATGTGIAAIVGQFPWGAVNVLTTPSSFGDFVNQFAPAGMNRLGSAYLSCIQKSFPTLKVVNILGLAAASATIASSTPANLFTVNAKYGGTAGNSIVVTVSAASNGNASYFNLSVSVTGASGTTTDFFPNLTSAAGTVSGFTAAQLAASTLTGSIVWIANGNPVVGSTTMSGGTNNSITATSYTGTLGTSNAGLALLESDLTISNCFYDDPGNSIRAACNAGMVAHCLLMTSQFGHMNDNSGVSASTAQTNLTSGSGGYSGSSQTNYTTATWPWAYIFDDTSGALQLVPPASFTASVCAQTAPSTRIAARDPSITQFLYGIQKLEFTAGANAPNNTAAGITTLIQNPKGGFTYELDVTTNLPQNPSQGDLPTWRVAVYVAAALQNSLQSFVNGPNVPVVQDSLNAAVSTFMDGLVNNQNNDPLHNVYIKAWSFGNFASFNTPASINAGNYYIPILFQTDAGMQKIFVAAQFGPTVSIQVTQSPPT